MSRVVAGVLFGLVGGLANMVCGQPTVSHISPGAVQPGATNELILRGDKLEGPLRVWTSFPADAEMVASDAESQAAKSRTCRLTLGSDAAVGIGGIVVGSPAGVSEVQFLMIDDLESVADNGDNHSPAKAQRIEVPVAVDGTADGSKLDHYTFRGKKGQRLSVELVAARLASELDAVVRLLRADGTELKLADDDASLGADCRFSVTLPEDADYLLEIQDNRYRSGGRYRLRVGDFPLVTVPYPLGARLGSTRRFRFAGSSREEVASLMLQVPDRVDGHRLAIAAKYPGGNSSSAATLVASELPEALETEPNDVAEAATSVTLPIALNGRFETAGDQDYFEFAALKDQSLTFQAISRSLGSPSVVMMRLYDEAGKQLAETSVSDRDEWSLDFKFPVDGIYRLKAEDLLRRGGPAHAYRVEVRPSIGFGLKFKPDQKTRFRPPSDSGAMALAIQCERQGYDGPVELSLEEGAGTFELVNEVIPSGVSEHQLIVAVSDDIKPGALRSLRIVGSAADRGTDRMVVAANSATWHARYPQMVFPPEWLNGLVFAAVGPESSPFYTAELSDSKVDFDRNSGQAKLTLSLDRANTEFKDALTVLVENLPAGFSSEIESENDEYHIVITGPKDARDAEHPFSVISYGEFKGQGVAHVQDALLHLGGVDANPDSSSAENRGS